MAITVEPDPMGAGGEAWYLSKPDDVKQLKPALERIVTAKQVALFRGFPDSLVALSKTAPLPMMAKWLRSLAQARCVLEVYETEMCDSHARLRFHFSKRWAPSFRGETQRVRSRIPTILREVHSLIGDVDCQFMVSGTLLPLSAVSPVATMEDLAIEVPLTTRKLFRAFYEKDGDCLGFDSNERTAWFGSERVDGYHLNRHKLGGMLDLLFETMLARRPFDPSKSVG